MLPRNFILAFYFKIIFDSREAAELLESSCVLLNQLPTTITPCTAVEYHPDQETDTIPLTELQTVLCCRLMVLNLGTHSPSGAF